MAENTGAWLTQDAFDRLTQELEYLSGPYRQEIVDRTRRRAMRVTSARTAATTQHATSRLRTRRASSSSSTCWKPRHIGDTPADDGVVEHGMVIEAEVAGRTLKFLLGSREIEDTLPAGSDLKVFSEKSPLGAAIMGAKQGRRGHLHRSER